MIGAPVAGGLVQLCLFHTQDNGQLGSLILLLLPEPWPPRTRSGSRLALFCQQAAHTWHSWALQVATGVTC